MGIRLYTNFAFNSFYLGLINLSDILESIIHVRFMHGPLKL